MKILLIDIDSKILNLALKKIEKYYIDRGNEVIWNMPLYRPLVDKIYVSCIFEWNKRKCFDWQDDPKSLIGGTGYNLKTTLPEEIEIIKPRVNYGFTSRGCIRRCPWCIVPQKEGKIRIVGDLLDLWDGKSRVIALLDNNILALPNHFKIICSQARKYKISIDFNQGLDCRLLDQDIANELKSVKYKSLRFSFDDLSYFDDVDRAITLLHKNGIFYSTWYILTGFNTTLEEDVFRAKYLRSRRERAYIMKYNNSKSKYLIPLSEWVNHRDWFSSVTWEEFLRDTRNRRFTRYIECSKISN